MKNWHSFSLSSFISTLFTLATRGEQGDYFSEIFWQHRASLVACGASYLPSAKVGLFLAISILVCHHAAINILVFFVLWFSNCYNGRDIILMVDFCFSNVGPLAHEKQIWSSKAMTESLRLLVKWSSSQAIQYVLLYLKGGSTTNSSFFVFGGAL
jgi:flagellar biosynthesis protein FlhB